MPLEAILHDINTKTAALRTSRITATLLGSYFCKWRSRETVYHTSSYVFCMNQSCIFSTTIQEMKRDSL